MEARERPFNLDSVDGSRGYRGDPHTDLGAVYPLREYPSRRARRRWVATVFDLLDLSGSAGAGCASRVCLV